MLDKVLEIDDSKSEGLTCVETEQTLISLKRISSVGFSLWTFEGLGI
jgi:hypothetical protein